MVNPERSQCTREPPSRINLGVIWKSAETNVFFSISFCQLQYFVLHPLPHVFRISPRKIRVATFSELHDWRGAGVFPGEGYSSNSSRRSANEKGPHFRPSWNNDDNDGAQPHWRMLLTRKQLGAIARVTDGLSPPRHICGITAKPRRCADNILRWFLV